MAAARIGVTGAPGVGKSSLVARLAQYRVGRVAPLAVIAVDPSSPHTSGSLLGDRIRMDAVADDPRIYIRSLASGQTHDGLSDNLAEVLATIDDFGFAEVILETVGVGQSEYGVRELADVELLVLMPGSGDTVQAMKAGILETADIVVINKADLPGAQSVALDLRSVLGSRKKAVSPPIVLVRHDEEEGLRTLSDKIDEAIERTAESGNSAERRRRFNRYRVHRLALRRLSEALAGLPADRFDDRPADLYRALLARLTEQETRSG
jgi:LAO/AO transport system kinase